MVRGLRALRTESAFVGADEGDVARGKRSAAIFTSRFHLQSHGMSLARLNHHYST